VIELGSGHHRSRLPLAQSGGPPEPGYRKFVRRYHHNLDFAGRFPSPMTARAVKYVVDRVSLNQRRERPLHVDMAGRANGRLQVVECPFDPLHHALPTTFSLAITLHILKSVTVQNVNEVMEIRWERRDSGPDEPVSKGANDRSAGRGGSARLRCAPRTSDIRRSGPKAAMESTTYQPRFLALATT
jgi:hypothetical protein